MAGLIGVLDSFPTVRGALGRLLGSDVVDVALSAAGIVSLTLARSPLGLTMVGLEALHSFTEVQARQAAWRAYEARIESIPPPRPGAVIHLEAGGRCPLGATVLEGTGTVVGPDGLPAPAVPGAEVDAGAPLYGGPFALELRHGQGFEPKPRPAPLPESVSDRYLRAAGPLSLAYAAVTTLATRSLARAFAALLLVNRRPALVGMGVADTGASARLLRAGVTVVGTRPERPIRLPSVLLLDGPRVLTDGFELAGVLPLGEEAAAVKERDLGGKRDALGAHRPALGRDRAWRPVLDVRRLRHLEQVAPIARDGPGQREAIRRYQASVSISRLFVAWRLQFLPSRG